MADPDDTVDAVGLALTSIEHPTALGGDGSYIDYIDPSKLIEAEVEINGELIVPQAFIVHGERHIPPKQLNLLDHDPAVTAAIVDLMSTFKAWLAIQMPVYDWRQEPEIINNGYTIRLTARGRLDIPTRVADHHLMLVELP